VRGSKKSGEEAGFEEHGFPAETEELLANVHDGKVEDIKDEPCGRGKPDRAAFGNSEQGESGDDQPGQRDDIEETVGVAPVEEARGFAPGGAPEKVRDGEQAVFAEKGLELPDDGEKGDEVNGGHAALDEKAGESEVAEVVVERDHTSVQTGWMKAV